MINKDSLYSNILNGHSKEAFLSFILFAVIGFVISALVEVVRARKKIREKGGFSIKIWASDNWARTLLSLITICVGVLYSPEIGKMIGMNLEVSNGGSLIAGFMTDKIIEVLITINPQELISKLLAKKP